MKEDKKLAVWSLVGVLLLWGTVLTFIAFALVYDKSYASSSPFFDVVYYHGGWANIYFSPYSQAIIVAIFCLSIGLMLIGTKQKEVK